MRVQITLGEVPWKSNGGKEIPHLNKFAAVLLKHVADYNPKRTLNATGSYGYPTFEVTAHPGDPKFEALLEELGKMTRQAKSRKAVVVWQQLNAEESQRARFLKPYYFSDFVDEDSCRKPLNPASEMCLNCQRAVLIAGRYPDFARLPAPFLVNKSALKNSDVFHTRVGLIVVRQRVLDLLKQVIPDQISFGEAAIANTKQQPQGNERLFWVQPKEVIGRRVRLMDGERPCSTCKRTLPKLLGMLDDQVNKTGPGLVHSRFSVEHFGTGKAEIAWVDESAVSLWPEVVMSGALLAFLKANDVKGIVAFTNRLPPRYLHSKKGDPVLEPQARTLGSLSKKPKRKDEAILKAARKEAAKLKDVPWDCAKDGSIYFHLSTPQFVVLDPMTGEEDSEGPYILKNFAGPGLYRLPVTAIKEAKEEGRGVTVDSATLLFVDNQFCLGLLNIYDWDKASTKSGDFDWNYHQSIAEQVGTRFGICSTPLAKYKSQFKGDGFYTLDVRHIERVSQRPGIFSGGGSSSAGKCA